MSETRLVLAAIALFDLSGRPPRSPTPLFALRRVERPQQHRLRAFRAKHRRGDDDRRLAGCLHVREADLHGKAARLGVQPDHHARRPVGRLTQQCLPALFQIAARRFTRAVSGHVELEQPLRSQRDDLGAVRLFLQSHRAGQAGREQLRPVHGLAGRQVVDDRERAGVGVRRVLAIQGAACAAGYDELKPLASFLWSVFTGWDASTGYRNEDIVKRMIAAI